MDKNLFLEHNLCKLNQKYHYPRIYLRGHNSVTQKKYSCGEERNVGGFIFDLLHQKLLIVQGPLKWSLPKGHSQCGETLINTATREICEETSIRLNLDPNHYHRRIHKSHYYFIIMNNLSLEHLIPLDHNEIKALRWVNRDELCRLDCNKALQYCYNHWDRLMQFMMSNQSTLSVR